MVGNDLRAADSECFKLVTYVGERLINEADVALLLQLLDLPVVPECLA